MREKAKQARLWMDEADAIGRQAAAGYAEGRKQGCEKADDVAGCGDVRTNEAHGEGHQASDTARDVGSQGAVTGVQLAKEGVETETEGTITPKDLLTLIERQGYRCALTGVELTPSTAELDHITPRSKGGRHVLSNVWFLHKRVNRAKGSMLLSEFRKMCSQVVQWDQ